MDDFLILYSSLCSNKEIGYTISDMGIDICMLLPQAKVQMQFNFPCFSADNQPNKFCDIILPQNFNFSLILTYSIFISVS